MSRSVMTALVGVALVSAACTQRSSSPEAAPAASDARGRTTDAHGRNGSFSSAFLSDLGPAAADVAQESVAAFDAENGAGASAMVGWLDAADRHPLAAAGEAVVIGFQNLEATQTAEAAGYQSGVEAAIETINRELGGVGARPDLGRPGRPVRLASCAMALNPKESARCADELASQAPVVVLQGVNFFVEDAAAVLRARGVATVVGLPATAHDLNTAGVFTLSGACFATGAGAVRHIALEVAATRIAVAYSTGPAGSLCYHDVERKALDIFNGTVPAQAPEAGRAQGMTHVGVALPLAAGAAGATGAAVGTGAAGDMRDTARTLLRARPAGLVLDGTPAQCWGLAESLTAAGWDPAAVPLVMTDRCVEGAAAGDVAPVAKSVTFVSDGGGPLDGPRTQLQARETALAAAKLARYRPGAAARGPAGAAAARGFAVTMTVWQFAQERVDEASGHLPGAADLADVLARSDDHHRFGGLPVGCAGAPAGYRSLCARLSVVSRWDGEHLVASGQPVDAIQVNAGTPIDSGR